MLRFAVDEDFDNRILRGLIRRLPSLDIVRIQDAGLLGKVDPVVLEWASSDNRILLTHDGSTMTKHVYERLEAGKRIPGVFEIGQNIPIGDVIDDLLLITTVVSKVSTSGRSDTCLSGEFSQHRANMRRAVPQGYTRIVRAGGNGWFQSHEESRVCSGMADATGGGREGSPRQSRILRVVSGG